MRVNYCNGVHSILRFICLTTLLATLCVGARSQQLPIKTYTTADGLPHDTVKRVMRDSRGFLWFCTGGGLSRFDGYSFVTYTVEHGFPHQNFNDVLETSQGIFWIATNGGGVARFRPAAASSSMVIDQTTPSPERIAANRAALGLTIYPVGDALRSNQVNVLYQDRAGQLWAGTDDGVFRLEETPQGGTFRRVTSHPLLSAGRNVQVWAFVEDREGSLWIATGAGLFRNLPDGRLIHNSIQNSIQLTLASPTVQALLFDTEGRLWMGCRDGLIVLFPEPLATVVMDGHPPWRSLAERNTGAVLPDGRVRLPSSAGEACRYTIADGLVNNSVSALHRSTDGRIWIGISYGGLTEFSGQRFHHFRLPSVTMGMMIRTLAEDRSGNLWVSAEADGALKITLNGFTKYDKADGLDANYSTWIFENRAGELCVLNGPLAINRFDGKRFAAVKPNLVDPLSFRALVKRRALEDRSGDWWVSSPHGLYRFAPVKDVSLLAKARPKAVYTAREGLSGSNIHWLYEDSYGDLWIGTANQDVLTRWNRATETFQRYTAADGLPSLNPPTSFREDRAGNLWIGFQNGGLARYAAGRFTMFTTADGVPKGMIEDIYLDSVGRLWVAGGTDGVARIDHPEAERPQMTSYGIAEGFRNGARCFTEDPWGRIYVGTHRGINRLDPATGHIKQFTISDGLNHDEVIAAFRDRSGALWFGTNKGLARLIPQPDPPPSPPSILIDGLRIEGNAHPISVVGETAVSGLELDPNQNQVQIDFTSPNFGAGERLRYQYRLEGADHDWSAPTGLRSVNYASLKPGRYRFLVRAINAEGLASAIPASVSFIILRPLWQRWWFVLLTVTMFVVAAYALHRYRLARVLELERVRTRIATDLHDDLGANLSQIAILSEVVRQRLGDTNGQVGESLTLVTSAARESVDAMGDIVWAINPKRDHLHDLTQRMRHFASEVLTARNIELQFHAPDADPQLGIDLRREVFLIFKEAINNLVRHSGCRAAAIEFLIEDGWLKLRITDDGRGFDATAVAQGHGLQSMRARAEKVGGKLEIRSQPGTGTTLILEVPLVARRSWPRKYSHLFRW